MELKWVAILIVVLSISSMAAEYEFYAAGSDVAEWSKYDALGYVGYAAQAASSHRVTTTVKPEECRLYLTYEDEGVGHLTLLEEAKRVKQQLEQNFEDIEQGKVRIEAANYSPEKSLGGMFRKDRDEMSLVFRITMTLNTEDPDGFWANAELVARVLDRVSQARKDGRWGKKLREGRVTYAVQSIEPTKRALLKLVHQEAQEMKDAFAAVNALNAADVYCSIGYGEICSMSPTLEAVEVILPYRVEFELKESRP